MGRHSKSSQNQTSNASVHRLLFFFVVNYANLAVLDEAHVKRALAEGLPLHVDAVFTDETVASFAAGHDALAGALAILLGVSSVKLVGDTSLSHFEIFLHK